MPLFNDLERVKLRFITTCEGLVAQGVWKNRNFKLFLTFWMP